MAKGGSSSANRRSGAVVTELRNDGSSGTFASGIQRFRSQPESLRTDLGPEQRGGLASQRQVPTFPNAPWKSLKRFLHFPTARRRYSISITPITVLSPIAYRLLTNSRQPGRVVAEAQGLNFPDDVGSLPRWLKESKALTKFTDNDITEFVEFKIKRDSPKWDSQPLWPAYVAQDITVYLRKHESDVGTKPNGHDETGFWISDRERDRRRKASGEGQTA